MPDCGGNDTFSIKGINDESHLQFVLQTVENYSISPQSAQSAIAAEINCSLCSLEPQGAQKFYLAVCDF
jgi:hypothetical protein